MDIEGDNLTSEDLRKAILNTSEPLIIQNVMKCDLIFWSLGDWENLLKDELLKFRCGKYQYTNEPQWESTCLNKQTSFQGFLDNINEESEDWWYFDYKYLCEWFTNKEVLKEKVNWSLLGFPEITVNESVIWIGSKGAHTPCHMDTYGCNIILQVYGRKQWILFPPEVNLKPTRIPFEESSIYSKLNFFSPIEKDFKGITHCRKVVLNPGDVLVLPHRWWHYVENLNTAISINAWLPLPQDDLARIKESIATIFVGQMAKIQDELKSIILNPNMIGVSKPSENQEMVTCDQALDIITEILPKCKPTNKKIKFSDQAIEKQDADEYVDKIVNNNYPCISKIPILNDEELRLFLRSQLERFSITEHCEQGKNNLESKKVIDFLEVITNDDVLSLIAKKLVEKSGF